MSAITYNVASDKEDEHFYKLVALCDLFALIGIMFSLFSIYWIIDIIHGKVYYEFREEIIVQCAFIVLTCVLCLSKLFTLTCCCCYCPYVTLFTSNKVTPNRHNLKTHLHEQSLPVQTIVTNIPRSNDYPGGQVNQNYNLPTGFPSPYTSSEI
ncbi:unnamed protein product [Heterobilharzia americana]|nr:unnamed protein product [Heterobilharzia americana]